jgi:hypothetical protein
MLAMLKGEWGEDKVWGPEFEAEAITRIEMLLAVQATSAVALGQVIYAIQAKVPHGQFRPFMEHHFSSLSPGQYNYWLFAYRQNKKGLPVRKPKALTARDMACIDDPEYQKRMAEGGNFRSPTEYESEIARLKKQLEKGQAQHEELHSDMDKLKSQFDDMKRGLFLPPGVKDHDGVMEAVRCQFGHFLNFWVQNLPDDLDLLRLHKGLHHEFCERLVGLWGEEMMPWAKKLQAALEKKHGAAPREKVKQPE